MPMEQSRIVYETLIKSRCSDSHWSKVKGLANTCGIQLDRQGLNLIINLRKLNPRYFNLYPQIQPCLIRLGESVSGSISSGLNGREVVELIQNELDINPNISTIYRWFYRSGLKFRTYDFYDRKTVMLILTNALIFKAKKSRLKANN